MTSTDNDRATRTSRSPHPLRRAWISVALMPVVIIGAFILSELFLRLLGYDPGGTLPLWVDILSWVVGLVVFLAPCSAAVVYGRRARSLGDRRGTVPLVIGIVATTLFLVMAVQAIASSTHI